MECDGGDKRRAEEQKAKSVQRWCPRSAERQCIVQMGGLSSFCITIASDFCCLVSGISHTEGNPSGISSTQAYSRKIVPICFLFQRRIRWRRAFFQLGRGKIKSWEGLRGGIRRTRSNSPVSNRDFLVPTGFTSSLLPLDRQWESRMMVKKENKKGGKTVKCFANWFREQT